MSDYEAPTKAPDGGGTAVLDRPKTKAKPRDWRDSVRKYARTVSCVIRDKARVGDMEVEGEVEPRWDGAYGRHTIALRRQGEQVVNANTFVFRSSLDWPGPLVKFLVHNDDGKAIAECRISSPMEVVAGMEIEVGEGKASFVRIERREGS